jgi:CRP-like cAMP-binding protein
MHGGSTSPNHNYERLLELYFQNPQFGYYFLVLTSQRLLQNVARAESTHRTEQNGDCPAGGHHRAEQD